MASGVMSERVVPLGEGDVKLGGISRKGHQLFSSRFFTGATSAVIFFRPNPRNDVYDWEISACTFTVEDGVTYVCRDRVISSSNSGSKIVLTPSHVARTLPSHKAYAHVIYNPRDDELHLYKAGELVESPFTEQSTKGGHSTARRSRFGRGSVGSQRVYNSLKGLGYDKGLSTASKKCTEDNT